MSQNLFAIRRSALTKALLYGHLSNIAAGLLTFAVCHWLLNWTTAQAVICTVAVTALVSVVVSILGTRRVSQPLSKLGSEIEQLHQKVTQSSANLTEVSKANQALFNSLPIGIITLNEKLELQSYNQLAQQFFDIKDDVHQLTEQLTSLQVDNAPINIADWLEKVKVRNVAARTSWPLITLKVNDQIKAAELLASYRRLGVHSSELILVLIDRSGEYTRQEKQMEFIAIAAHELRGPITVMRGLIEALQHETDKKLSAEEATLLTRLSVSGRQLAGYVNNILNVSRVEQDGFAVKPQETNWQELVSASSHDLSVRAHAHSQQLKINLPKKLPALAVDPVAIQHVITNLVDNAIKYSKQNSEIILSASLKDGVVETTVQDFGVGIPASLVDNLFTKFYRSHRSKQLASGTGLGLYLCKAIIEAHGGNIWVRSTEGVGTTFGFTLPTFESVAEDLKKRNTNTSGIIRTSHGWIKNHALYRR